MSRSRCMVGDCTWTALGTDSQLDVAFERHYRDAHADTCTGNADKIGAQHNSGPRPAFAAPTEGLATTPTGRPTS